MIFFTAPGVNLFTAPRVNFFTAPSVIFFTAPRVNLLTTPSVIFFTSLRVIVLHPHLVDFCHTSSGDVFWHPLCFASGLM